MNAPGQLFECAVVDVLGVQLSTFEDAPWFSERAQEKRRSWWLKLAADGCVSLSRAPVRRRQQLWGDRSDRAAHREQRRAEPA